MADGFISSSRLSLRLWSQSLSFERKHQSSKQWPKRPRSSSPLEVVSIYLASFRCKLHCACRITHAQQRFCQAVWMYRRAFARKPQSQFSLSCNGERSEPSLIYALSWPATINRDPSLALRMTTKQRSDCLWYLGFEDHASITTGVPSSTISNNSITSALRIRTQP